MRVLTFSTVFPSYHPRKGEDTDFILKIGRAKMFLDSIGVVIVQMRQVKKAWFKFHTIRQGKRHKVGDVLSARYWEGKPYRSKQKEFAKIEIKKIWDFEVDENGAVAVAGFYINEEGLQEMSLNDGLAYPDFQEWIIMPCFRKAKPFSGQILCWANHIDYTKEKYFTLPDQIEYT